MPRETEAKFRLPDPDTLRRRLASLGATRKSLEQESNLLLDTPNRDLLNRGCGLRIRVTKPLEPTGPTRATLAYKGPLDPNLHQRGIKSREEIEIHLSANHALAAILDRIGFAPVLAYDKRRETWQLGAAKVMLDDLPVLGWFVEIEADQVQVVESTCAQLDLDPSASVRETYPELTATHGTLTTDGRRELRF